MDSPSRNHAHSSHSAGPAEVPLGTSGRRAWHRIGDVRRLQGFSIRRVIRRMHLPAEQVKQEEQGTTDLSLSRLYHWQQVLEVPIEELLVESDAPLSRPVLERAGLVKLMKTAAAIQEQAKQTGVRRLAENLVEQLTQIMPELKDVGPWQTVGQRRTLDELGRAASVYTLIEYEEED